MPQPALRAVRCRIALVLALGLLATVLGGCLDAPANGWAAQATQLADLRGAGERNPVRVAILDTGIDLGHPSLAHLGDGRFRDGELVAYSDLLGGSRGPHDKGGHGTFVAGVLAAQPPQGLAAVTGAGEGVQGLDPEVELMVGRVCLETSCGLTAVWRGLEWALANGADIVSLSLGYTAEDLAEMPLIVERMQRTLAEAEAKGVLVVAAAGNTNGPLLWPAREPTVLAVGAVDRDLQPRFSSARGYGSAKPDLVAPGEGIVGPARDGGRVAFDGTSAAVPFVVAAAARMMAEVGAPQDASQLALLRQSLLETASPLDGQRVPHDPWAGHGLLQARDALERYRDLAAAYEPPAPCQPKPWHACP